MSHLTGAHRGFYQLHAPVRRKRRAHRVVGYSLPLFPLRSRPPYAIQIRSLPPAMRVQLACLGMPSGGLADVAL